MYDLFVRLLLLSRENRAYLEILQRLINDSVVDIEQGEQLQLSTVINVLAKYSDNFTVLIGNIDQNMPIEDYLSENNIFANTSFNEFIDSLSPNQQFIISNLIDGRSEIIN